MHIDADRARSTGNKIFSGITWFVCLTALTNLVWGYLGDSSKFLAAAVSLALMSVRIASHMLRPQQLTRVGSLAAYLAIGVLVLASIIGIAHSANSLIKARSEERSFDYRVDYLVRRFERLYRSTYMPQWLYADLKRIFARPFNPSVYDESHMYSDITATYFHLGNLGVVDYEFAGRTYLDSSVSHRSYFLFQGEAEIVDHGGRIDVRSLPDAPLRSTLDKIHFGSKFGCLGFVDLPDTFAFRRRFCAPTSMRQYKEGFLLDMQNLAHPPMCVHVNFVTDRNVENLRAVRLKARQSFSDWFLGEPRFREFGESIVLEDVGEVATDAFRREIELGPHRIELDKRALHVYSAVVYPKGGGDTFVLKYEIR